MAVGAVAWTRCFASLPTEVVMPRIQPPKPPNRPQPRLDEEAIDRLALLLLEDALPHGGLPLEGVDGLFSAALVSPGTALELTDLLPLALGQHDGPASEELSRLLSMMWDVTRTRIARHPEGDITDLLPLIEFPLEDGEAETDESNEDESDEFPVGATWALGFILGYGLRRNEWEQRLDADEELAWQVMDIFALASPILDEVDGVDEAFEDEVLVKPGVGRVQDEDVSEVFAFDVDTDDEDDPFDPWLEPDEDDSISLEERFDIIADLPGTLHELHLVALEERAPKQMLHGDEIPGRNDPCPCGSGSKFKACHGDPSRLH